MNKKASVNLAITPTPLMHMFQLKGPTQQESNSSDKFSVSSVEQTSVFEGGYMALMLWWHR